MLHERLHTESEVREFTVEVAAVFAVVVAAGVVPMVGDVFVGTIATVIDRALVVVGNRVVVRGEAAFGINFMNACMMRGGLNPSDSQSWSRSGPRSWSWSAWAWSGSGARAYSWTQSCSRSGGNS